MRQLSSGSLKEPVDKARYTAQNDKFYTRFARIYDFMVKVSPLWRNWLMYALPYLQGPRILEISFGTGYLLTQYAGSFEVYGIDYNRAMLKTASRNLERNGLQAALQQADVCRLPYANESINTIVNTMAFSGYPDGHRALAEMRRVLKPGGRLVMIDVSYPPNRNWLGMWLARFWRASGDILRDMQALFDAMGMACTQKEIGGLGTVQLYMAEKS
jgi:ubiquinone/menaquinone biosynthesis C-methylase UbiE